jgi:hypothetical protein
MRKTRSKFRQDFAFKDGQTGSLQSPCFKPPPFSPLLLALSQCPLGGFGAGIWCSAPFVQWTGEGCNGLVRGAMDW